MSAASARYTSVAIALHWAIAAAIVFVIWLGWNMDENEARYQLHKSIGIAILLLTLTRVIWRILNPPPPLPDEMAAHEKLASHLVHMGFYGLMIAMPLTGWLYVSTAYEFDVPTVLFGVLSWPDIPGLGFLKNEFAHGAIEQVHSKLAWLAIGLLALHLGGALKHEFSAEDGVLKRMVPALFGKSDPPQAPGRGYILSFGAAFGALALISGTPLLIDFAGQSAPSGSLETADTGNWRVNYESSTIGFSGIHDGDPYSGGFSDWQAIINFEPDALETASAYVTVSTGSATANKKLYTDSLKAGEWLSSTLFPTAMVELKDFTETGSGYQAIAALTLKDITVETEFDFTLSIDGDAAIMNGTAGFQRTPLDLGLASDPGADWVSEDITVTVYVEASRQ